MDLSQFRLKTTDRTGRIPSGFQVTPLAQRFGSAVVRSGFQSLPQDATINELKSSLRRNSRTSENAPASEQSLPSSSGGSGIRSLLKEVKARTSRIEQLREAQSEAAAGGQQSEQFAAEIAAEEQSLQNTLGSPEIQRIFEILGQVQRSSQSGASAQQIAKSLQSNAALLGGDFIARVGNGDFSNLSLFGGYLSTIQTAVSDGRFAEPGFSDLINRAVSGALKALDGPALATAGGSSTDQSQSSRVAPLPQIDQLSFGDSEGLAVTLRGYIGADALQAAMAHLEYDPRDALVLLDNPEEDPDEKRDRAEVEDEEKDARFSAGFSAEPD